MTFTFWMAVPDLAHGGTVDEMCETGREDLQPRRVVTAAAASVMV